MKKMLALGLTLLSLACNNSRAPQVAPQDLSTSIKIPPKQLIEIAQKVIAAPPYALSVEESERGKLVTGYQSFQGDYHIVRYWPQRTRYIVKIAPDFDDPNDRSHLEVAEETEQQVAGATVNGQPKWTRDADMEHPERAAALGRAIREAAMESMHK